MKRYDKFSKKVFSDEEGYQSATPEIVANYRASRLRCETALDCCCGIGGDTMALAKVCHRVIAIDKSAERIAIAKKNAMLNGLRNVRFINADIFKCSIREFDADVAFADPQRRRDGRRVNDLEETEPDTTKLIDLLSKNFESFCIEAPSTAEIPYDCEREYISWESRKGKRECILSLYFGGLKRCGISAVVLPGKERLEVNERSLEGASIEKPMTHLYEPKVCIKRASLENELAESLGCFVYGSFLTSDKLIGSGFFENSFVFLSFFERDTLIKTLRSLGAGKIVLRGRLQPDEHKRVKSKIEEKLSGHRKLHVFLDEGMICASLSILQNSD